MAGKEKTYVVVSAGAYVKRAGGERADFLHRGATFTEPQADADHLKHLLERGLVAEGDGEGGLVGVDRVTPASRRRSAEAQGEES